MQVITALVASLVLGSPWLQDPVAASNSAPANGVVLHQEGQDRQKPAQAPADAIPSDPVTYIEVAMLGLGLELATAALMEANMNPANQGIVRKCKALCKILEVELPPFQDERGEPVATKDRITADVRALNYLLAVAGPKLSAAIERKHGRATKAAFELGMKSVIGLLLYEDEQLRAATKSSVVRCGEASGLPGHLWRPLEQALAPSAGRAEFSKAVVNLQARVTEHLKKAPRS